MTSRRSLSALASAVALAAGGLGAGVASPAAADPGDRQVAPLRAGGPRTVSDRYIVVLHPQAASAARGAQVEGAAVRSGGKVNLRYSQVLDGFAATLPAAALEAVRADPAVA